MNGDRLPVVTALTCLSNRFDVPGFSALGERLVLHDGGGAIAVWGPTGLASEEDLLVLDKAFFKAVFVWREKTLGEAVLRALRTFRRNGGDVQAGLIYNLLGDPCLRLRLQ
jgi:hypothetical protein